MNLDDKLYSSTEVADILGVSLRSVYRYLEENKINADIKTATGRHRFTRQNILDFLYPDGSVPSSKNNVSSTPKVAQDVPSQPTEDAPAFSRETPVVEPKVMEPVEENKEVDWLSKFKAAAERHRAQVEEVEEGPVEEVIEETFTYVEESVTQDTAPEVKSTSYEESTLSSLASPEKETTPSNELPKVRFYKSSIGGLKELAQYISKTASKSGVAYAFTMNAGLSLHKLIRPFSVLHIYVKENDLEFFEKALELAPSEESNAQLGIYIDRTGVLGSAKEMHGLSVVSNDQLRKDLVSAGEVDLASELDEVTGL